MIKKIMKMGGCKTEAEFYKKYPTEKAFLEAFPQARPMMEQFQKGGTTGVAFPQAPTADRFFNYGAPTPNIPRFMQKGGENKEYNQEAFMQIVGAVAQHHRVEPKEVLTGLRDNLEDDELQMLTDASVTNPEEVLTAVNTYTTNYLGQTEEETGGYQYLEGQPYMQQMLSQQSEQAAPEENYQMPMDPNMAMQMAHGGSKLRRFIPKHQTKGPVQNQQPPVEEDSFWDSGWGTVTRGAGIVGGTIALQAGITAGWQRLANSETLKNAVIKATEKLDDAKKVTAEMWAKMSPSKRLAMAAKHSKNKWVAPVLALGAWGVAEAFDWFESTPEATQAPAAPGAAPAAAPTQKQPNALPPDSSDAYRIPAMPEQKDTSKIQQGNKTLKTKTGASPDTITTFGWNKKGGEKKKFQPGGVWNRFSNYMSSSTPGDWINDFTYNFGNQMMAGSDWEWTRAPRTWEGSYTDEQGNEVVFNENGTPEERANVALAKARHQDLLTRAQRQSELAEQYPYQYSARPEWLGGSPNWKRNLAWSVSGLGEKFDPDYHRGDDFTLWDLSPHSWITDAAQSLGESSYRAQITNSSIPYLTSIGYPLLGGASVSSNPALRKAAIDAGSGVMSLDVLNELINLPAQPNYEDMPTAEEAREMTSSGSSTDQRLRNKVMGRTERVGDPFKANPKDRRPRLKKGGQSALMGTNTNDQVVSERISKLKNYINENTYNSILKDEQQEISEIFRNPQMMMPQEQPMEQGQEQEMMRMGGMKIMAPGGTSSGFVELKRKNPFSRRRTESGYNWEGVMGPWPEQYGEPAEGSYYDYDEQGNVVSKSMEDKTRCPDGYKYDPKTGQCVIAQTRAGRVIESAHESWKNISGDTRAGLALGMSNAVVAGKERQNAEKYEEQLRNNLFNKYAFAAQPSDKGYHMTNQLEMVPPTMETPVQFTGKGYTQDYGYAKKGGEMYLTDEQIKHIISLGGQVEFLD